MAKTEKMTDEASLSLIDQHVTDALGYDDSISTQREKAMEYYYGLPFGNEIEGRSQFISSDVADTIEWIMPSLMRIFCIGGWNDGLCVRPSRVNCHPSVQG